MSTKQKNVNSPVVNSPVVNNEQAVQPTEQQASPTVEQPTEQQPVSPTEQASPTVDSPTVSPTEQPSLFSVASLLTAYTALTARETLVTDITARHATVKQQIEQLELNDKQATKLRAQYGITDSLDNDLSSLSVDATLSTAITELQSNNSVETWLALVTELEQANSLLQSVNSLREKLGLQTLWLAHNGLLTTKRATTRGQSGSEEHSTGEAKFVRPGIMHLGYNGVAITWASSVTEHTLSGAGKTVTHKQGSIGVHSALKNFIQNDLGFTGNISTPVRLAMFGYDKNDVYMLVQPDATTEKIKQPVKQAVK